MLMNTPTTLHAAYRSPGASTAYLQGLRVGGARLEVAMPETQPLTATEIARIYVQHAERLDKPRCYDCGEVSPCPTRRLLAAYRALLPQQPTGGEACQSPEAKLRGALGVAWNALSEADCEIDGTDSHCQLFWMLGEEIEALNAAEPEAGRAEGA